MDWRNGRMSRSAVTLVLALGCLAYLSAPALASGSSGDTWGRAQEVPGTAALNQGGYAYLASVSCASVGNCSAGGYYYETPSDRQAFVVSEVNGSWGTAEEVPGTAVLNQGGGAGIYSVSCASAGNCSAGGDYADSSSHNQAFVVSEVNGSWGTAEEVPGTAALNPGGNATVYSVSCGSAGNCSAGGVYSDSPGKFQAFMVSETGGTWRTAKEVPGTAVLNQGGVAEISSVSCASAGNCSAGGSYIDSSGHYQAFVITKSKGIWGTAEEVPGTAALNQGEYAYLASVSCASAGNCTAGGIYSDSPEKFQAFIVGEVNGIWGTAEEVPGTAALNQDGDAGIRSVSCASAGNCSAGGDYADSSGDQQAFVITQTKGSWGTAEEVPGTAALNQGGYAWVASVSCGSAGNCSAGGYYGSPEHGQAFVVSETRGTWRIAKEVPGTAALNQGDGAEISSMSCASAGNCTAGGYYTDQSGHQQVFVVSEPRPAAGPGR